MKLPGSSGTFCYLRGSLPGTMICKSALLLAAAIALPPAVAAADTYVVDPTHTSVMYEMLHFGISTSRGRFVKVSGQVTLDRAAATGRVEIRIDMKGLSTGVEALDRRMARSDFFDIAAHPSSSFVGDEFEFDDDKVRSVVGALTIKGVTHRVTLAAERFACYTSPLLRREICGGDFTTTIKRSLWGVSWGLDLGFPDETPLRIQVEAVKQ